MKIASTPKSKRALIMSLTSILVIGIVAAGSYLYLNRDKAGQTQTAGVGVNPIPTNNNEQSVPDNNKTSPNHTPQQYTPPSDMDKQSSNQLTGVINYKSVNDGVLSIRVTIDQRISDGTCALTLTNKETDKTVTRNADVATNPSSSTCRGFDIPVSNLSSGDWAISIKVISGDQNGNIKGSVSI